MALVKTIFQKLSVVSYQLSALSILLVSVFIVFLFSCSDTSTPIAPAIDNIDPAVEWVHPQAGGELSGVIELRFRVSDEGGIDSARVYLDGYSPDGWQITDVISELQVIYWNTVDSDDGVHILEARAWDKAGNLGTSPSLRVIVSNDAPPAEDRTPPDLWWLSPEAGSTLTDTVTIQIGFFDESGVDSVQLLKDGAAIYPPYAVGGDSGGVIEYLWNTLSDSDGVHLWEARAWDMAGNIGVSAGLLVRVQNHETPPEDHKPPVITWLSPEPGDTVQGTVELHFQLMDDVDLDSAKVFVNGTVLQNLYLYSNYFDSFVTWITSDHNDGIYIVEVRAWDSSGNIGSGEIIWFQVWNNRPRVIWVPDEYEKIQDAINASEDGDTVRVRAGTYREGVRLFGKNIWLESETGPEVTFIDGTGWNDGIWAADETNFKLTVIRGFKIYGEVTGIHLGDQTNAIIYNCIFIGQWEPVEEDLFMAIWSGYGTAYIYNCVFDSCSDGVVVGYGSGLFENSIVVNGGYGYYRNAVWNTWSSHGWNLYWNNVTDLFYTDPNENEIFENPQFINRLYHLSEDSPAINAGNPEILDLDESRSDLGVYGGPYAY